MRESVCMVSIVLSHFRPLPTCKVWTVLLTSLFTVCQHTTANVFLQKGANSSSCHMSVGMFFIYFQNLKCSCYNTHLHTTHMSVTQIELGFFFPCPASYFTKSNFACLQLSATVVWEVRFKKGGDWSTCS